jgi:hypothetical protein
MTNPTDSSKEIPQEFEKWIYSESLAYKHRKGVNSTLLCAEDFRAGAIAVYRHLHPSPSPSGWRDELIAALEKYNELLGNECSELVGLAAVHGWRSTRFEEGVRQRAEIEILKTKIINENPPTTSGDKRIEFVNR